MHAYSTFTIDLTATESDVKKLTALLEEDEFEAEEALECDSGENQNEFLEMEECYEYASIDELEILAAKMASLAPSSSFTLQGIVDISESTGQYMDFVIEYKNRKLVSRCSDWYIEHWGGFFADYEEFCEEVGEDENGEPWYSEEEFEEFCEWETMYILDDGDNSVVSEVPLDYVEEINIAKLLTE